MSDLLSRKVKDRQHNDQSKKSKMYCRSLVVYCSVGFLIICLCVFDLRPLISNFVSSIFFYVPVLNTFFLFLRNSPDLTWRDVQHLIAQTSRRYDITDDQYGPGYTWKQNGGGLYGLFDNYSNFLL